MLVRLGAFVLMDGRVVGVGSPLLERGLHHSHQLGIRYQQFTDTTTKVGYHHSPRNIRGSSVHGVASSGRECRTR